MICKAIIQSGKGTFTKDYLHGFNYLCQITFTFGQTEVLAILINNFNYSEVLRSY